MNPDQATLTLNITVTLKPEPNVSAQDKEANLKQIMSDVPTMLSNVYDWGVAITGTLESSETETVDIDVSKPDYIEE